MIPLGTIVRTSGLRYDGGAVPVALFGRILHFHSRHHTTSARAGEFYPDDTGLIVGVEGCGFVMVLTCRGVLGWCEFSYVREVR